MAKQLLVSGLVGLLLSPPVLLAQDRPTFGINLGVVGLQQIGITYQFTPAVAVRPAVVFAWSKRAFVPFSPGSSGPVDNTSTTAGLDLDLLFPVAADEGLTPYLGVGGDVARSWFRSDVLNRSSTVWGLNGLFGVRATVIERFAVYGELGLRYTNHGDVGGLGDRQTIGLGTSALGVLVYLK